MSYNAVGIGNQPEDGLGDGLRTSFSKTNTMLRERYETSFIKDGRRVTRFISDPAITDLDAYRVDDIVEGWVDGTTRERWVKAVIINATGIAFPADFDTNKTFLIEDKLNV